MICVHILKQNDESYDDEIDGNSWIKRSKRVSCLLILLKTVLYIVVHKFRIFWNQATLLETINHRYKTYLNRNERPPMNGARGQNLVGTCQFARRGAELILVGLAKRTLKRGLQDDRRIEWLLKWYVCFWRFRSIIVIYVPSGQMGPEPEMRRRSEGEQCSRAWGLLHTPHIHNFITLKPFLRKRG